VVPRHPLGYSLSMPRPPAPAASPASSRTSDLLPDAVLLLALPFLYSHAFTSDYVMKDEMGMVGWAPRWPVQSPVEWGADIWKLSGRWLGGFLWNLPFALAADEPARLRLVRFALVMILAITAVVTRRLLDRTLHAPAATTLLVLAIFAQGPFWSYAGYGAGTFWNVSGLLLALAAFALVVPRGADSAVASGPRLATSFACLSVVMQIHQGLAMFGLVPLVAAVLADWPHRRRQSWSLLFLVVAALAVSVTLYKWNLASLHARAEVAYDRGEKAMALANSPLAALRVALDPRHYWPAFRLWSFPYPFERVRELGGRTVAWSLRIMTAWAILVAVAAVLDARRPGATAAGIATKWATFLACLGLAVLPILADEPARIPHSGIRPHTSIVAVGVVLVTAAWAGWTISARWPQRARDLLALAALVAVATWCAGARSSLRRGLVAPAVAQLAFARSALAGEGPVSRILVVAPSRNGCVYEPCDGWSGDLAPDDGHVRRPGFPRWALSLERGRIEPPPEVVILSRPPALPRPEGEVVVDWNEFVRSQARRKGIDWKSLPTVAGAPGPGPKATVRSR